MVTRVGEENKSSDELFMRGVCPEYEGLAVRDGRIHGSGSRFDSMRGSHSC